MLRKNEDLSLATEENRIIAETNPVLAAISSRRSIRRYKDMPITKSQINAVLSAGLSSPSAKNQRPFHFIVVEDKNTLITLSQGVPTAKPLAGAACCVVVCGDNLVQENPELLHADCFAATQNMLLAVHSLGLGGVWCGIRLNTDWHDLLSNTFNLPENILPLSIVSIGVPDEIREVVDRFDESKLHYENW